MKILLDENVNRKLRLFFPEFDITTVKEMDWLGKKNGDLLSLAIENNFRVIISNDANLKFQQNLLKFDIYFLIIKTKDNNIESLIPLIESIKEILINIQSFSPEVKYFEVI